MLSVILSEQKGQSMFLSCQLINTGEELESDMRIIKEFAKSIRKESS